MNLNIYFKWTVFFLVATLCLQSALVDASSPFVKVPQEEYQVEEGRRLELPCVAARNDAMCAWMFNGTIALPMPGFLEYSPKGDCSLVIPKLNYPHDNTVWTCQAVIPGSDRVSHDWPKTRVVVLVKPSPPLFKDDIIGPQITAGKPSSIVCESKGGNPLPSLEWYLNGENITLNATAAVKGESVISTLSYVFEKRHNASSLACKSVHPLGEQNVKQKLNVLYKPIVSVAQKVYTVVERKELEIDCQVDSNPPSQAFWKPSSSFDLSSDKLKINGSKLKLFNIDHKIDGLSFQCSAQNSIGNSEPETVTISVLYKPRIIETSPTNRNVSLGDELQLVCKFSGNPKPTIKWNFVDSIYSNEHSRTPSSDEPGLLIIKNVSYSDEGDYYCEGTSENAIEDKVNKVRSNKMVINVVGKPQFLKNKWIVTGYQGANTKIEQTFCSDPAPTSVQWSYDGSIQHNVDVNVKNKKDEPESITEEAVHINAGPLVPLDPKSPHPTCFKASLLVSNTDIADSRDFALIVKNGPNSVAEGIISLQVYNKLSGAMIIAISLILLAMLFTLTVIFILFLRRRTSSNKRNADCEDKSDARVPINDSTDAAKKSNEK